MLKTAHTLAKKVVRMSVFCKCLDFTISQTKVSTGLGLLAPNSRKRRSSSVYRNVLFEGMANCTYVETLR